MISTVPPNLITTVFEHLRPQIEKALRNGQGDGTTADHILAAILNDQMTLWVVHEGEQIVAGVVISLLHQPNGNKLFVELLAGTGMDKWVGELEQILKDARDLTGATCIEASCRLGLAKKLRARNWKQKAIIMECPL